MFREPVPKSIFYETFQVDAYLEELARNYPATVTLVNAGNSIEGRPIKYLRISTTDFQVKYQK